MFPLYESRGVLRQLKQETSSTYQQQPHSQATFLGRSLAGEASSYHTSGCHYRQLYYVHTYTVRVMVAVLLPRKSMLTL